MPYSIRGEHVNGLKLSYGTAILSKLPMEDPLSITFSPTPPSFPKGFVISTVTLTFADNRKLDIVSLHLDFLKKSSRKSQLDQIAQPLSLRINPLIVMGDFNCDWSGNEPTLRIFADKFDLKAYQPDTSVEPTHVTVKKRLDWILIASELKFVSHKVLSDSLSDHRALVAEISWNEQSAN